MSRRALDRTARRRRCQVGDVGPQAVSPSNHSSNGAKGRLGELSEVSTSGVRAIRCWCGVLEPLYIVYIYIYPSPFCPPFSWLCLNGTSWWVERQHHHLVALEPLRHQQSGLQVEICKAQGDLKGLPSPCPTMHEHPKHMLYYIP